MTNSPLQIPALSVFLGLTQVKGIGFKTMRDLGGPWGVARMHADELLVPCVSALTGVKQQDLRLSLERKGDAVLQELHSKGVAIITQEDPLYPLAFRSLPADMQPLWLFCRGNLALLQGPSVAVVGTRAPTTEGEFLTRYAAYAIRQLGLPLVSGLALGVDGIAHETALQAGLANISVLGTGILRPYPARNLWMADAIVDSGGLLISEYFPDAGPAGDQFVWRNRLQAGLSSCIVATQWKKSSGTAHTIRFAKAFDRPSINIVPNGLTLPIDHGVADHRFLVPEEHARFMECIYKSSLRWPHVQPSTQPSLFG